jgi:hypothetical protein
MNVTEKVSNIINKLERAVSYEDWGEVEKSIDDLTYLYEELESSFPIDEWDDDME